MTIDLLHNKIVANTVTEGFIRSVNDNLVPKLRERYGESLAGIQMYEDYLNDEFIKDGFQYYPLTVNIGGVFAVLWIKWDVSNKALFEDGIPYSYVGGDNIDFLIVEDVPIAFSRAIENRSTYYEGGCVKLTVNTDAQGATILAGKYSQTFVDEMARQLTVAISRACGVSGLADSSIEIHLVFAPSTYMEHTSENVTYRRLLISAKGCAPRDFWVKWTRLDSAVAFGVCDNVSADNILFEIGEDVSHKIREKEYRFLVWGNSDKYRVAMGRKNITEWRELIKRSVKRGELEKTTADLEVENHATELSDKLSEILEKCGVTVPDLSENIEPSGADIANEALRMAVLGESAGLDDEEDELPDTEDAASESNHPSENNYAAESQTQASAAEVREFNFESEPEQIEFAIPSDADLTVGDLNEGNVNDTQDDEAYIRSIMNIEESEPEYLHIEKNGASAEPDNENGGFAEQTEAFDTVTENAPEAEKSEPTEDEDEIEPESYETEEEAEADDEDEEDDDGDYSEELDEARELLIRASAEIERLQSEVEKNERALENEHMLREDAEKYLNFERLNASELRAEIEKRQALVDETRAQADKEIDARRLAEAEADRLRAEIENALRENARLTDALAEAKSALENAESKYRECEEALMTQRDLYDKEKIREKDLFAEAARQAMEEREREAREFAKSEALRMQNEAREEVERLLAADDSKDADTAPDEHEPDHTEGAQAEVQVVPEYIEKSPEQLLEERRLAAIEKAMEQRLRMEEEARQETEAKVRDDASYAPPITTASEGESRELMAEADEQTVSADVDFTVTKETAAPRKNTETTAVAVSAHENHVAESAHVNTAPKAEYTYTSKLVRILFRNAVDPNITNRLHEMIALALTQFNKESVYMKVKAGVQDSTTVVLNFVKFPEEEEKLLIDIIHYLGNSDLGIYKIILE